MTMNKVTVTVKTITGCIGFGHLGALIKETRIETVVELDGCEREKAS